jgi:cobalt-zinc-cadmium efflux system membrane fusion protein
MTGAREITMETKRIEWMNRACAVALAIALAACGGGSAEHAGEEKQDEVASSKGPHGGRMLEDGDFAIELAIFERGVPPEFRAWAYQGGEPIPPAEVQLEVELRRFGNRLDRIGFAPAGEFLRGDATVEEPHSFDATVRAKRRGGEHRFTYSSYEGRVTIDAAAAKESGVAVEVAGPAQIKETLQLYGRIEPDGDRTAHVTPRFPGIVVDARKRLGDAVAKDEVVAIVESNESLRPYEVRSRIAGTIIEKHAAPGEFAGTDAPLYVVSDLGRVWADLQVHRSDAERLRVGQRAWVDAGDGGEPIEARVDYVSPLGSFDSQTTLARLVVDNASGRWRPGLFVSARVEVETVQAPVAVRTSALQRVRDWDVVFLADGDSYEAQPVELGLGDGTWTEIRAGLSAGQPYAATGSFILKADVGKSGASHDH